MEHLNDEAYYSLMKQAHAKGMTVAEYERYKAEEVIKDTQALNARISEMVAEAVEKHLQAKVEAEEKAQFEAWKANQSR